MGHVGDVCSCDTKRERRERSVQERGQIKPQSHWIRGFTITNLRGPSCCLSSPGTNELSFFVGLSPTDPSIQSGRWIGDPYLRVRACIQMYIKNTAMVADQARPAPPSGKG